MSAEHDPLVPDEMARFFDIHEAAFAEAFDAVSMDLGHSALHDGALLDRPDPSAQDKKQLSLEALLLDELSSEGEVDISAEAMAWFALRGRVDSYLIRKHSADSRDEALLKFRLFAAPTTGVRSKVSELYLTDRAKLDLNDDEYRAIAASMDELGEK